MGSTTVTLPEAGDYTLDGKCAIGQIIIEIPRGTAVRIDPDTSQNGRDFPASYREEGDPYVVPGYDEAESLAEVTKWISPGIRGCAGIRRRLTITDTFRVKRDHLRFLVPRF